MISEVHQAEDVDLIAQFLNQYWKDNWLVKWQDNHALRYEIYGELGQRGVDGEGWERTGLSGHQRAVAAIWYSHEIMKLSYFHCSKAKHVMHELRKHVKSLPDG